MAREVNEKINFGGKNLFGVLWSFIGGLWCGGFLGVVIRDLAGFAACCRARLDSKPTTSSRRNREEAGMEEQIEVTGG